MKSIACLVIDFNSAADAEKLTLQLARGNNAGLQVGVFHVDNGSDTKAELSSEQRAAGVKLIRNDINRGYAGGIRTAIEKIRAGFGPSAGNNSDQVVGTEYDGYWILNCDLEVESDALAKLAAAFLKNPRVAAAGPRVMKGRTSKIWGERGVVSPVLGLTAMTEWPTGGVLPRWSYIPGSSILVRTKAYDEVGGIPDRYRLYYEETELCVQFQKRGWDLWVEPAAVVYHAVQSMKSRVPARHYAFYFARNNLYFWKNNFGIPWIVQLPRTMFVIFKELVVPLRRSDSFGMFFDRLKFTAMGFADGFFFLYTRYTFFEKKYFNVTP
ncbi:MAG: hypothetical protein ABL958_03200 [Bdellovibrionia bacterium]